MYELRDHSPTLLECPNCGKRALAQTSSERYECLWCNFHRDLSHRHGITRGGRFDGGLFFFVAVAVCVGLIAVGG